MPQRTFLFFILLFFPLCFSAFSQPYGTPDFDQIEREQTAQEEELVPEEEPSFSEDEQYYPEEPPAYEPEQSQPGQPAVKLAMPAKTELAFAKEQSRQKGVRSRYYKYFSTLERQKILDFYRHLFSEEKGYFEERRGLPKDDTQRSQFLFVKGTEELVLLGFFYNTEAKGKITYFVNFTIMDLSQIPKPPDQ